MALKAHHRAWLEAHPSRTEKWLLSQLADGFDIHHIDANPLNNSAENLVLIDHADHMRIHDRPANFLRTSIKKKEPKQRKLYPKPIGPKYHWRFIGRVPLDFTIEHQEKVRERISKRWANRNIEQSKIG